MSGPSGDRDEPGALRIDRARFFVLTAAIASACGPRVPAPQPVRVPADYDTTESKGGSTDDPEAADPGQRVAASDAGLAITTSGAPDAGAEWPAGEGMVASLPVDPACEKLAATGPACESMGFEKTQCSALMSFVEAKPAASLVKCIVDGSNGKGQCPLQQALEDCPKKTLRAVRRMDAGTAQQCQPIVQQCRSYGTPGFTVAQCQALLTVVKASDEPAALTCMSEGCGASLCFLQLAWMHQP